MTSPVALGGTGRMDASKIHGVPAWVAILINALVLARRVLLIVRAQMLRRCTRASTHSNSIRLVIIFLAVYEPYSGEYISLPFFFFFFFFFFKKG